MMGVRGTVRSHIIEERRLAEVFYVAVEEGENEEHWTYRDSRSCATLENYRSSTVLEACNSDVCNTLTALQISVLHNFFNKTPF